MNLFKKQKGDIQTFKSSKEYEILKQQGEVKSFDADFFASLEGKYWQGLPLYYFLENNRSMGICCYPSYALGLVMGEGAEVLFGKMQADEKSLEAYSGHVWVEFGDKVYDPVWQIICDKDNYYSVLKPNVKSKANYKQLVEIVSNFTDSKIRTKDWYETHPTMLNYLIFQIRASEELNLKADHISTEEKEFARKVLKDLPKTSLKDLNETVGQKTKEEMFEQ